MLENSPNYSIPLPNKTDEETDVADSLATGLTIVDTELKNRKDELESHQAAVNAHESSKIKHGDGSVQDTLFELGGRIDEAEGGIEHVESRISTIVAQAGTDNTEIVDARGGFTVLHDRLENIDEQLENNGVNIKNLGAIGDGSDAKSAISLALLPGIETIVIPKGVFTLKELSVDRNVRFVGKGEGSILKMPTDLTPSILDAVDGVPWKVNSMFFINKPVHVVFENITFDGDCFNQTEIYNGGAFVKVYKPTLLDSEFVSVTFKNCQFVNNNLASVLSYGSGKKDQVFFNFYDNYFGGGQKGTTQTAITEKWAQGYSPTHLSIYDSATVTAIGNKFIDPILPDNTTTFARIAFHVSTTDTSSLANSDLYSSSLFIINNVFKNLGRHTASPNGLGVIDMYVNGEDVVVSGNKFINSQMQSVRAKVNVRNLIVSNNVIQDGLDGGISLQPNNFATKKTSAVFIGNIIERVKSFGILISGNSATDPATYFENVVIKGNIVKQVTLSLYDATLANGINLENVKNVVVAGNLLKDIGLDVIYMSTVEDVTIEGNNGNSLSAHATLGRAIYGQNMRGTLRLVNNELAGRNSNIFVAFDAAFTKRSFIATGNHSYSTTNCSSVAFYAVNFITGVISGNMVTGIVANGTPYGYQLGGTLATLGSNVYYDGVDQAKAIKLKTNVTTLKEANNSWN